MLAQAKVDAQASSLLFISAVVCAAGSFNVSDGAWHMLTLTTLPDGSKGFRMYVDGALAGQLPTPGFRGAFSAFRTAIEAC